jgi:hypothetical protein
MLVLTGDLDTAVVATMLGLRDHVRTWARGFSLDSDLARGVPPEHSVALALRADRLAQPATRQTLARSLRRLSERAHQSATLRTPTAGGMGMYLSNERRIRANAAIIAALADRLERPGPVSTVGIAKVCMLLRDGSGPLQGPGTATQLAQRIREAFEALDVTVTG